MTHHHLRVELPERVEREADDNDDRRTAQRNIHLCDRADADRKDRDQREEDAADQRDL